MSWKLAEDNELDNRTETFAYTTTGDVALYTDKTGNKHKYAYTPYYEIEREDIFSRSGEKLYSKENTYDTNSRQLKKESNSYGHSVTYDYDDFHRTTSFATQGKTYKIRHQANGQTNPYNINDLDDLVDEFTYSNDSSTRYRYDALGRLSNLDGVLSGKIQYQYNTDYTGDSVSVSYPNGTSMTQQVNSFGEIIQTSHSDGWLERNNYDGFGNITEVRNNEGVSQYKYDKIDRIEEDASSHRAKDITYEYDELGNRKTVFAGDFTPSTEDRSQKYDALNRLTQAKQGDKTTDYTYYPDGLRASKSDGNDTTQYIYYNGQVIEELDGSGRSKAQNVFGNGLVFRKDAESGKSGYYLFNSHGDVTKLTDAQSGRVLNQYQYDIWGNPKKDGIFKEEMSNPFRYSGEILDAETGMYYLRARYYDPSVGRFISEDTYKGQVDNPLSLNRYTYVHNSPLRFVDPSGHMTFSQGWESFKKGVGEFFNSKNYEKAVNDLTNPRSYVPLTRELVGPENFDTLTDGQLTFGDAKAAGMATFSFFMGRLKVLDNIGEVGKLTYIGNKTWKSSQGLIYGFDKKYGNRIQHVLEHTKQNFNRATHTVFNVNKTEVLSLVDEAWALRKTPVSGDPGAYIVDMGRVVGTNGEKAIRIVVKPGTSEILSAYPVMP